MCVIIYCPKGTKIKKQELEDAFNYNNDGAGIGWIDEKGFINFKKGFMSFENFYNKNKEIINNTNIDRVIHFRIGTSGTNSKGLTHPYILDSKNNKQKLRYHGKKEICFMNGVLQNQTLIKDLNDTASFILESKKKNKDIKKEMIKTSPKWAIIGTDGVELIGKFEEDDGIYYSNFNHRYYNNNIFYYNDIFDYYTKSKKNKNIKYIKNKNKNKKRNIYKIYNYEIERIFQEIDEEYFYYDGNFKEIYQKHFDKFGIKKSLQMTIEEIIYYLQYYNY